MAWAFGAGLVGHFHFIFGGSDSFGRSDGAKGVIEFAGFAVNNGLLAVLRAAKVVPEPAALAVAILVVPTVTFLAARFWGFVSHD